MKSLPLVSVWGNGFGLKFRTWQFGIRIAQLATDKFLLLPLGEAADTLDELDPSEQRNMNELPFKSPA